MWSSVIADNETNNGCHAPSSRSKHSATLVGNCIYVLGGRNGNLPLKDFWKYNLGNGKWQQLKPNGDKLPCLQEHSAVSYKECIYVFGGEMSFSASNETPLWVYDINKDSWKKLQTKSNGKISPKGRRGHSALVYKGRMYIYGGYQDLRGSCGELWSYEFESNKWQILSNCSLKKNGLSGIGLTLPIIGNNQSNGSNNGSDICPPPRHKHSAVLHEDSIWIYGGMTDLQERGDFWKWDILNKYWCCIKIKINPGPLHSHAACKLPSSMIIFGGERDGHSTNDLWKYSFCTETWDKINIMGLKPQPRAETVAFAVSELLLKDNRKKIEKSTEQLRINNRHSSYLPEDTKMIENTYTFEATEKNYNDGSEEATTSYQKNKTIFDFELTKISNLNKIHKIRNSKCNYSVLGYKNTNTNNATCTNRKTESTESLLRQFASPSVGFDDDVDDSEITTSFLSNPNNNAMVKSKSAYAVSKKNANVNAMKVSPETDNVSEDLTETPQKQLDWFGNNKIPRDPLSVPNFTTFTLPTPSLTPIEATRLVFLDPTSDEEENDDIVVSSSTNKLLITDEFNTKNYNYDEDDRVLHNFKREASYNSHLGYADNPLYQHLVEGKKNFHLTHNNTTTTNRDENVSATSDYSSIETVNRLSSVSSNSVKYHPNRSSSLESSKIKKNNGIFGFSNPNYTTNSNGSRRNEYENNKVEVCKMLNVNTTPDSLLEESKLNKRKTKEEVEFQQLRVVYSKNNAVKPKSLDLEKHHNNKRASSASRAEENKRCEDTRQTNFNQNSNVRVRPALANNVSDHFIPLYVFIVGGKEHGQVTVFKRPLSIWKLKLY